MGHDAAITAALWHLVCAALFAAVICASLIVLLILASARKFRGAVNDAVGELRSNFEDH